jgi:hypothetical protein
LFLESQLKDILGLTLLTALHIQRHGDDNPSTSLSKPGYVFLISAWFNLLSCNQRSVNPSNTESGTGHIPSAWGARLLRNSTPIEIDVYSNFAAPSWHRGSWKEILPEYVWVSAGENEQSFNFDVIDFVRNIRCDGIDAAMKIEKDANHAWQTGIPASEMNEFLKSKKRVEDVTALRGYRELADDIVEFVSRRKG